MAPGRFRPWTTSTRGLNAHHAPESGIETLRMRCIPVCATARRSSHPHIRADGLQRERNLHLELPIRDCPARASAERARIYPCPCMLRRHDTGLRRTKTQRSIRQVNTPSEEQWNCRGPQFLTLPLSNAARPYNVVPPAPALTVPAPQGAT